MVIRCTHLEWARHVAPRTPEGCEECLESGDRWVHLRICLTCGQVGCCDSSPNRHATAHHQETGHPLIRSFEPGEQWAWCYVDALPLKWPMIYAAIASERDTRGAADRGQP
jgi:uncharacterized UBP type Zn finger protein